MFENGWFTNEVGPPSRIPLSASRIVTRFPLRIACEPGSLLMAMG